MLQRRVGIYLLEDREILPSTRVVLKKVAQLSLNGSLGFFNLSRLTLLRGFLLGPLLDRLNGVLDFALNQIEEGLAIKTSRLKTQLCQVNTICRCPCQ